MENSKQFPEGGRTWPQADTGIADPAVAALAEPLTGLASLPVPDHSAVYAALHDGLLAELNADPSEER